MHAFPHPRREDRAGEALRSFTFSTAHAEVMRNRRKWFLSMAAYAVLWWVPRGHRPTVGEAEERLARLRAHGPTPTAFSFKVHFPDPSASSDLRPPTEPR